MWLLLILTLSVISTAVQAQSILSRGNMVYQGSSAATPLHLNDTTYFVTFNASFDEAAAFDHQIRIARVGDSCWLQMPIAKWKKDLPSGHRLVLTPLLRCAEDSAFFPSQTIYGKWAYYHALRQGCPPVEDPDDLLLRGDKMGSDSLDVYVKALPWQDWMTNCSFIVRMAEVDGCGDAVSAAEQTFFRPETTGLVPVPQTAEVQVPAPQQVRRRVGTAYVDYPLNKVVLLPDFHNNRYELDKICEIITKMNSDSTIVMTHIALRGYASPEGTYTHNEYLARERSNALRRYIIDVCGLSDSIVSSEYVPEDWAGFRHYVAQSELEERADLLTLIDERMEPDAKLRLIADRYPSRYRFFCDSVFPRLRRTDYRIDYVETYRDSTKSESVTVNIPVTPVVATIEPIEFADAWTPVKTHRTFRPFSPLLAVKTNMLYDLVLAPNVELETQLGLRSRCSLMAEYTTPWWRWSRLDHSYEVQEGGLELRFWFAPRCPGSRPWLSGHFLGLYGATAKYDLEYDQSGDQGEIVSGGLSYGYSWPIARRWNLEFSLAAGFVMGERRHYRAEFESTHLIYKYTKNLYYVGPTKLKLSLVYLLGRSCRKGGDR